MEFKKTDIIILGFMVENLEREYSIIELTRILKKPYVKIHKSIKRLVKMDLIIENIRGKSHYCSLNYKDNIHIVCFIKSQKAREFLQKNKKIKLLIEKITANIKTPDYILSLFGSYAKDTNDKYSDIDLVAISSNKDKEEIERVINSIKRMQSLKIHSLEFSYEEYIEMLKNKNNSVGREISINNIIFKGYEQFYNCLILGK